MKPSSAAAAEVRETLETLTSRLIASRNAAGHWEGRLASSAVSTATAVVALTLAAREGRREREALAEAGADWLVAHQNADGGWGDTVASGSNLSTAALCWAALSMAATSPVRNASVDRVERWLDARARGLGAGALRRAIVARYGKDRTFSVPILTVLAIAGRLGEGRAAWRRVPQLPFELAACPHRWFEILRLPVVSYALPALIAIGQARHHHAPTRNPLLRPIRSAVRERTLTSLLAMQPSSGGYLEATPLTAFVTMSLISAGRIEHPVTAAGLRFLTASAREDGSWPIDTNLATWLTTLSVAALADGEEDAAGDLGLDAESRARLLDWLLGQQAREEHPFTHAAPGGWAWTDLSGGVPDADDTAGALLALAALAREDPRARAAAAAGVGWLLDLQNRDGGMPTFCRGWGALPFDRSAPDLTAHALRAWSAWAPELERALARRAAAAARRAVAYLAATQGADGRWVPLWFGNEHAPGEENPVYGTSRVLLALGTRLAAASPEAAGCRDRGLAWLLSAQGPDGGWGGAPGTPCSIEETGLALQALRRVARSAAAPGAAEAARRGTAWLVAATEAGRRTPPAPIGLYFAKLWYFEELYPLIFARGGVGRR
jgi:squalene-hopene/tetraprenyl-beta-curcumene cyclase